VVGYSYRDGYWGQHAFLYSDGTMLDLNTLLAPEYAGWDLTSANGINDNGWIIGGARGPDGLDHAFLLTPEPGTIMLLAFGGMMLRRRSRRQF
jgi:probable HAF family extracellular repeat protein